MLTESRPSLKPSIVAAILLLAWRLLREAATWPRGVAEILAFSGASKSHAYELVPRLLAACQALEQPAGRPALPSPEATTLDVTGRVRDFVMDHPGCVSTRGGDRRHYAPPFRRFVFDLAAPDGPAAALSVEQLAAATGVPLGTLKDWLAAPRPAEPEHAAPAGNDPIAAHPDIATIVAEWKAWQSRGGGGFRAFCDHLRNNLRLRRGHTFIASVLLAAELRAPKRRNLPAFPWTRDTYTRLFPGAQWLGDGTTLAIRLNGELFAFNLEAVADVASGAFVGLHVSDAENEAAVLKAFEHGRVTTGGEGPVGLTLDNKPCNHTDAVRDGVAPTTLIPATPARGQAKAPLEGEFGLFAQTAPPLVVAGKNPRELARSVLALVCFLWTFGRNGRPRRRLGGRPPADVYREAQPTEEQRAAARAHAAELVRRHERFTKTRERRADPVRRALLTEELPRLGLDDPDGRWARSFAVFSLEAIQRGIATYAAKRDLGTLTGIEYPHRFLGGIVRNLDQRLHLERAAHHLLALRLRHEELALQPLQRVLADIRNATPDNALPRALTERALDAERTVDFRFWTRAAQDALARLPRPTARSLFPDLARRVAAAFHVDAQRREDLIARLSTGVLAAAT